VFAEEVRATELAVLFMLVVLTDAVASAEFAALASLSMFADTRALALYALTLLLAVLTLKAFAFCLAFDAGLAAPTLVDGKLVNDVAESVAV
jgi:hypothetical protein